jgi:hypothetical protein
MIVIVRSGHAARTGPAPIERIVIAAMGTMAATDIRSHTRLNMALFPVCLTVPVRQSSAAREWNILV